MDFDDAVFVQRCKALAKNSYITLEQVAGVLWDLVSDMIEPERAEECKAYIRQEYAHSFCWQLTREGLIIQRLDS